MSSVTVIDSCEWVVGGTLGSRVETDQVQTFTKQRKHIVISQRQKCRTHSEVPEDQVSRASAEGHESCARMIGDCFGCSLCGSAACHWWSPAQQTFQCHQQTEPVPEAVWFKEEGVRTGKKSDWGFVPAAPLVWVQPVKPLENSAYPGRAERKPIRLILQSALLSGISCHGTKPAGFTCKCVMKDSLCRGKGSQPSHRQCPPYTSFPPCCVAAW